MRSIGSSHPPESEEDGDYGHHHRLTSSCQAAGPLSETSKYNEVIGNLRKIPEVVECHFVTGKHALLVKLFCTDHDHLMRILVHTIQNIPYIASTDTMISLDQAIERQVWVDDVPVRD